MNNPVPETFEARIVYPQVARAGDEQALAPRQAARGQFADADILAVGDRQPTAAAWIVEGDGGADDGGRWPSLFRRLSDFIREIQASQAYSRLSAAENIA